MATPVTALPDADAVDAELLPAPPGALTETSPGQTDRVKAILARQSQPATDEAAELSNTKPNGGITFEQARELTDEIKMDVGALRDKLVRAYTERAWDILGYESWDTYCAAEFESVRLRLPLEERQDIVCSLREAGFSIRAIASGVGISDQTVQRDLKAGVANHYTSPEDSEDDAAEPVSPTVTGRDGKRYPKQKPVPRPPRPSRRGGYTSELTPLRKALREVPEQVAQFNRIADDDQFRTWFAAADSCVTSLRREVAKAITALEELQDRLESVGGEDK